MRTVLRICCLACLLFFPFTGKAGALTDTLRLYFNLDKAELSQQATAVLDSLVYYEVLTPDQSLFIIGYADNLGGEDYNLQLSEERAEHVRQYLAGLGINKTNVKLCTGKGEVMRAREIAGGYRQDRRVDIVTAEQPVKKQPIAKAAKALPPDIDTTLTSVRVGQTLVLRNIYFYAGRHVVRDESLPQLEKLYATLKAYPKLKIRIEGHVCCVPVFADALDEDTFEKTLSVNRARYIYDYLIDKGIGKDRLSYEGYGRRRPVVRIERTLEDEDLNRRVEIRVMGN